jgi:hypothetical protein
MEKTCSVCQQIKNLEEFGNKRSVKKDGKSSECKECKKKRDKEYRNKTEVKERKKEYDNLYYQKNKDWLNDYYVNWRLENKERKKEYDLNYRKENTEKIRQDKKNKYNYNEKRSKNLKRNYGISSEEYESMLAEQKGACYICGEVSEGKLAVDHDHKTFKVRKLLCGKCNTAIGLLKEDTTIIENALNYIKLFS